MRGRFSGAAIGYPDGKPYISVECKNLQILVSGLCRSSFYLPGTLDGKMRTTMDLGRNFRKNPGILKTDPADVFQKSYKIRVYKPESK